MRALSFVMLAIALTACDKPVTEQDDQLNPTTPDSVNTSTKALKDVVLYPELIAQAQVTSRNISKISAEIPARIEALPVETGQRIAAGKVIAKLDCRDSRIGLNQAEAQLATAEARFGLAEQQLKRSEELAAKGFISGDALDQRRTENNVIRAEMKLHLAQVQAARRNVSKCVIVSPFDAVVESRLASAGELASPGTPLLTLWDISGLEVAAQVQQKDTDSLARATAISLETPDASYPLVLKRISPAMDSTARTREARLVFAQGIPHPGASGRIKWQSSDPYLPPEFVLQRDGLYGVFVADGGKARFVPLPDAQEGRPAKINLPPDTEVVVNGRFALKENQAISAAGESATTKPAR